MFTLISQLRVYTGIRELDGIISVTMVIIKLTVSSMFNRLTKVIIYNYVNLNII